MNKTLNTLIATTVTAVLACAGCGEARKITEEDYKRAPALMLSEELREGIYVLADDDGDGKIDCIYIKPGEGGSTSVAAERDVSDCRGYRRIYGWGVKPDKELLNDLERHLRDEQELSRRLDATLIRYENQEIPKIE